MKLTQKFAKEAHNKIRGMLVWADSAAEAFALVRCHRAAADIEHCAHVTPYYESEAHCVYQWYIAERTEVVELGLLER